MRGSASRARRTSRPFRGDGVDAEQVAVGQGAAGLARLDGVVVAGADDQVAGAGLGAVGDGDRGAGLDDAEGDEVVADAAVQLAAQRVVGGHQQGVGAAGGEGDVGVRGGVHHLLRVSADDPGVLVVLGEHRGVAVAQPQAGGLFPAVAEPDGFGQPGVAEGTGEQGHAAAVFHGLQLAGVPGQDHLPAAGFGVAIRSARSGPGIIEASSISSSGAGPISTGPRAPRRPGRWPRNWAALYDTGHPGGQGVAGGLGRGDPDHLAQPGRGPGPAGFGQHAGLAGPGRGVDHRYAPAVGQRGERGGGLVLAQPAARARVLRVARACRPARRRAAPGPRRARARPARGPGAARCPRALA